MMCKQVYTVDGGEQVVKLGGSEGKSLLAPEHAVQATPPLCSRSLSIGKSNAEEMPLPCFQSSEWSREREGGAAFMSFGAVWDL